MSEVSELYAYEPYDGPLLEDIELYLAKSGEELINDQIYSFKDRGDRTVVIRPEMTPTVARMVSQIHREVSKPLRWYAIPNLMRYEKPQKGRLREFWQYNADIFGGGLNGQVEILQLAVSLMTSFGATSEHFEILLNDRTFVDLVFAKLLKLENDKKILLYKLLDKKNKIPEEKFNLELHAIISDKERIDIFKAYSSLSSFENVKDFLNKYVTDVGPTQLLEISDKIESLGLGKYIKYDPSIVRGLDYYTGLVFEIFDKNPENRRAIAGGGAYANLLQIFNEPPLEGVGFGMGEVPLTDFLTTHKLRPSFEKQDVDYLVGYLDEEAEKTAFDLSQKIRLKNKKVELFFGPHKPKKIFGHLDKKNFKFLILIGTEEMNSGKIKLKNLSNREETTINLNDFIQGLS